MVKTILSKKQINTLVKNIAKKAEKKGMPISKAFVFGSYAKNKVNQDSDLDLCFVSSKFEDRIKSSAMLRTIVYFSFPEIDVPLDIAVYKPKNFTTDIPLVREIKQNGKEIKL